LRILTELEAYRDRLMDRAAAFPQTSESELARDLAQCEAQVALLEKGVEALRIRLAENPPQDADGTEALQHRLAIQDQMRELTAAYAEVLRRHLAQRTS